jgi:uncharacterized membrane protein YkgB
MRQWLAVTPSVATQKQGTAHPDGVDMPGQFLLKDLVLLGAATFTVGETLVARTRASP